MSIINLKSNIMNYYTAEELGRMYHPHSALVIYQSKDAFKTTYVEQFDMDAHGSPINAHPLTVREAQRLSKSLNTKQLQNNACFTPKGILSSTVLSVNSSGQGKVIWYSKPQKRQLFFIEKLGISNGIANLPTLVWKATKNQLSVYAIKGKRRPTLKTKLYYAPFFNVYESGSICMGTVNIKVAKASSLEEFIEEWEILFFNSYFSHLLDDYNPIKKNMVSLWQDMIGADKPFPKEVLKQNHKTLKDLL